MPRKRREASASLAGVVLLTILGWFGETLTAIPWLSPLLWAGAAVSAVHLIAILGPVDRWLTRRFRPMMAVSVLVGAVSGLAGGLAHWWTSRDSETQPDQVANPVEQPITEPKVDTQPARPVITVTSEGPYLVVRNTGAPAAFRAHLLVAHTQEFPSVTEESRFEGIWQTTMTDQSEIATGDEDRVMLGAVAGDRDTAITPFHFYDAVAKKMGVREARQMPDRGAPTLWVDITIVSVPALAGGPQTFECTVSQGRVDFLQPKP